MTANPRNSDTVVATAETLQPYPGGINTVNEIIPGWEDEFAGRIGFGYQWASGSKVFATAWGFSTEQPSEGNGRAGGNLYYAIGPPIYHNGGYVGVSGTPGYYNIMSKIEAQLADVAFGREHAFGESFRMEWSAGLRYANFEEALDGFYDNASSASATFGQERYAASKANQGEMIGVRVAARGSYRLTSSFFLSAGLGYSFLDGEVNSASSLSPNGTVNGVAEPSSFVGITESGRSGNIIDLDLIVGWNNRSDTIRIWAGWEQSDWQDIAADLVRNFPGTAAPLRDRDSVVISGYKLGVYFRF
jgi:hypothetical protein